MRYEVSRLRVQLPAIKLHRTDSSVSGCPTPRVALSSLVLVKFGHPVEEGSQGAATLADLAFAPDVNDKLSESKKVCFFTSQICQPCSIPLSEFEVES